MYLFESGYDGGGAEAQYVRDTMTMNGWSKRAYLGASVTDNVQDAKEAGGTVVRADDTEQRPRGPVRLDAVMADVGTVNVLKIDVDSAELVVLRSAAGLLARTEAVQLELVDGEVGLQGKIDVFTHLCKKGFQPYAILEDLSDSESVRKQLVRGTPYSETGAGHGTYVWVL